MYNYFYSYITTYIVILLKIKFSGLLMEMFYQY